LEGRKVLLSEVAANGERFLVTSHQKVMAELNPASSTEAADGIPDLL
jgi:hypothetical protein